MDGKRELDNIRRKICSLTLPSANDVQVLAGLEVRRPEPGSRLYDGVVANGEASQLLLRVDAGGSEQAAVVLGELSGVAGESADHQDSCKT